MAETKQTEVVVLPDALLLYFGRDHTESFSLDLRSGIAMIGGAGWRQFAVRFAALRSLAYRPATQELEVTWQRREGGGEDRQTWVGMNAGLWNTVTSFLAAHPLPGVAVELRD